jgi:NADH:ubiquinone oxidoreductase subunit 3 (subunit A)
MHDAVSFLLPGVFGVSLIVAMVLYMIGGRAKPKIDSKDVRKTESYACGELLPVEEMRIDLEKFLVFTVYFLIFDVLAFTLATSFYSLGLYPTIYSLVVLIAVVMLILSRRHH